MKRRGKKKTLRRCGALLLLTLSLSVIKDAKAEGELSLYGSALGEERPAAVIAREIRQERDRLLEEYRYAVAVLKAKYPSHMFAITGCSRKGELTGPNNTFLFRDESRQETFRIVVYRDRDQSHPGLSAEDNYYGYLLKEPYEEALLSLLQEDTPECFSASVTMKDLMGEEYNETTDPQKLLDGTMPVFNRSIIMIDGRKGGEPESLFRQVEKTVRSHGIYGSYRVYVKNGTKEEDETLYEGRILQLSSEAIDY